MKLLTIDIGATSIKHAVMDDKMNSSHQGSRPTPMDSFESFLDTISEIHQPVRQEVEGIAIAMPGIIDPERGHYFSSGVLRYPHDPEVASAISRRCGCPVAIENDGKAAALAEYRLGCLKGCLNAAVFIIGTGVGGGLIINGQLVRGPHFSAGEYSYLATQASTFGDESTHLGSNCSTSYLLERYCQLSGESRLIDGIEFFRRLPEDPQAQRALDELCTNIAIQLYNLYWLLDLEKAAIGGGISRQPLVSETIRRKYDELWAISPAGQRRFSPHLQIVPCRFYNEANQIGAFLNFLDQNC